MLIKWGAACSDYFEMRPKLEIVAPKGRVATVGGYDVDAYVFEEKDVVSGLRSGVGLCWVFTTTWVVC